MKIVKKINKNTQKNQRFWSPEIRFVGGNCNREILQRDTKKHKR